MPIAYLSLSKGGVFAQARLYDVRGKLLMQGDEQLHPGP